MTDISPTAVQPTRKRSWLRTLAFSCALIPFAQCALVPAQHAFAAETPVEAPAPAPASVDADPALWVVKDADTTIYLFGTVHVLKPGLSWFDEAVKDAFDKSDQLMLEVVLPEDQAAMASTVIPLAMDMSGTTLSSRLTADQKTAYDAAMKSIDMEGSMFDMFEPWFVGVTLSVLPLTKFGYDTESGAEKILSKAAKASGKPVAGFETVNEQLGYFDTMPMDMQLTFFNNVVRDLSQLGPTLDTMVGHWAKGDPEALAGTMNASMGDQPDLTKVLLHDRNQRWATALKARMEQPGTVFVAVGAGHLAGDKSVQDYLAELGLTAERVAY